MRMELKDVIRKYFQDNWSEDEKDNIENCKMILAHKFMGQILYTGNDVNMIVTEPDSLRTIQLKSVYQSLHKDFPSELDYLHEIGVLYYLHTLIPGSEFIYDGDFYTGFETDDLECLLKFELEDEARKLNLSLVNIELDEFLDDLKQRFHGKVKSGVRYPELEIEMPLNKYTLENAYEALCDKLMNVIQIYNVVTLDLGENGSATIHNDEILSIEATEYTDELDKLLSMIDL